MERERIIVGIDPGTNVMGFGVIHVCGAHITVLDLGVIAMQKIKDPYEKMGYILEHVQALIDQHHPQEMAIEAPFFGKNVQSMLKLGRAQGVAIAAALSRHVSVHEYAPRKIKLAITGKGAASKEQVALMLQRTIHFTQVPTTWDATDALAAAVCHAYQSPATEASGIPTPKSHKKSASSWKAFVAQNPDLVKKP